MEPDLSFYQNELKTAVEALLSIDEKTPKLARIQLEKSVKSALSSLTHKLAKEAGDFDE